MLQAWKPQGSVNRSRDRFTGPRPVLRTGGLLTGLMPPGVGPEAVLQERVRIYRLGRKRQRGGGSPAALSRARAQ